MKILQIVSNKYANFMKNSLRNGKRISSCSFRQRKAVLIEPDGNTYLCGNFNRFILGNTTKDDFSKIWLKRFSRKDWRICRKCESNCYIFD